MQPDLIAEINLDALRSNVAAIRLACANDTLICGALKANAYGHGAEVVVPALTEAGVDMAAVATISEAVELRRLGWSRPILCFGPLFAAPSARERAARLQTAVEYDLTVTLVDGHGAEDLNVVAFRQGRIAHAHVKVDTGMGRMGIAPGTAYDLIQRVVALPGVRLEGLYTHLATADEGGRDAVRFAHRQVTVFRRLIERLSAGGIRIPIRHAANSAASLSMPSAQFDMVRPGLALYGYRPGAAVTEWARLLRPLLRLRTHIVMVKRLPAGRSVGYGRTFTTRRDSVLGIVPIGYNDGYSRALGNRAVMGMPAGDAPVVGRISMDQAVLDLTDLPAVKVGDPVTVIDDRRDRPNSVESLACLLGTIPYEVTCLLGNRVARVAVSDADRGVALHCRGALPAEGTRIASTGGDPTGRTQADAAADQYEASLIEGRVGGGAALPDPPAVWPIPRVGCSDPG